MLECNESGEPYWISNKDSTCCRPSVSRSVGEQLYDLRASHYSNVLLGQMIAW